MKKNSVGNILEDIIRERKAYDEKAMYFANEAIKYFKKEERLKKINTYLEVRKLRNIKSNNNKSKKVKI